MIALAVLLNSSTSGLKTVVKSDWNGITTFAVRSGSASAKFFGTSSPSTIESIVAIATPTIVPIHGTLASGSPSPVSGPVSSG